MNIDQIRVNYNTQMRNVKAHVAGENFYAKHLDVHFDTDTTTALNLSTEGLKADLTSPMHVMQLVDQVQPLLKAVKDSASLFALIDSIPSMALQVHLTPGHPLQRYVDSTRAELRRLNLAEGHCFVLHPSFGDFRFPCPGSVLPRALFWQDFHKIQI